MTVARIGRLLTHRYLTPATRLALGGVFIVASISKLSHQAEFINTVTGYGILPHALAQVYGAALPWAELFIGCCLVFGIFSTLASTLIIPLTISFMIASAYGLFYLGSDSCGCFGELVPMSYSASLAVDIVMLLMVVPILLYRDKAAFLSIGALLSRLNPSFGEKKRAIFESGIRFAVIAVAVLAIGLPLFEYAPSSIDSKIDRALEQGKPAFLFFYREGCGACEDQKPIISVLESEYGDRIVFILVDYREEALAVSEFEVDKIPTMFLIVGKNEDGEYLVYQRFNGSTTEDKLRDSIDQVVRDDPP
ncbi:MAG: conjugal transfer protein TraF [Dehalococcoidia bacterium]|nr:conjugal transfer protein TraF [Dehalococcoidia bacterium]